MRAGISPPPGGHGRQAAAPQTVTDCGLNRRVNRRYARALLSVQRPLARHRKGRYVRPDMARVRPAQPTVVHSRAMLTLVCQATIAAEVDPSRAKLKRTGRAKGPYTASLALNWPCLSSRAPGSVAAPYVRSNGCVASPDLSRVRCRRAYGMLAGQVRLSVRLLL